MADSFIRSELLERHGITGLFTTRQGGTSEPPFDSLNFGLNLGDSVEHVAANLTQLCASALLPVPHQARQVHGRDYRWCNGPGTFHDFEADALLSREAGSALAVRTADCLPVLLADPGTGMAAAVHAGWRGTVANIVADTIEAMTNSGAERSRIVASLGPCIGPCCFAIDRDTAATLATCADGAENHVKSEHGRYSADLSAINREQLLASGILPRHIEILSACTSCHPERFFSHRRDRGETGRHLAVVALPAST